MELKRVVITGMSCITPLGIGADTLWQNLISKKSGISLIDTFDTTNYSSKIAGICRDFDPLNYLDKKEVKRTDRFIQFAIACGDMAYKDSGLKEGDYNKERVGVIVGSGIGGLHIFQIQYHEFLEGNQSPKRISPFFIPMLIPDMAGGMIAIRYGFAGPNFSISTACASATHSMGIAYKLIQMDKADIIFTGGTEAAVTPFGVAGFIAMKALSTRNDAPEKASRPFDKDRDGFVMAEGCGVLVFESLEHAKKRNAKIYAEVIGFGMTDDAYHIAAPCPAGEQAARCMAEAIADAKIRLEDIDYINTHGTSTPAGDVAEINAIKSVFGVHSKKLKINSTKSMIGHLLGAAGAVELIATIKSIQNSKLHPTINIENQDSECDLDCVPNEPISYNVRIALSNSFGFGGHNSSIIIKKFEG